MLGDAPYKSTKGVKRMSVSQADTDLFAVIPDTRWVLSPPPKKCKIKCKDFYFVNFFRRLYVEFYNGFLVTNFTNNLCLICIVPNYLSLFRKSVAK